MRKKIIPKRVCNHQENEQQKESVAHPKPSFLREKREADASLT
ncbi:hypothetical protein [Mitsuokella sp. oral taxon 131]|nr:hypothetical protein [Mitsuokella sp. oral taxon 131]